MATAASNEQLTLFDMPPDTLWRLPEARKDRDTRLAVLLRNIFWQHGKGECRASNEFFAHDLTMGLRCDVATVRRALAELEACGLVKREFDNFGQRTIHCPSGYRGGSSCGGLGGSGPRNCRDEAVGWRDPVEVPRTAPESWEMVCSPTFSG